MSREDTNVVTFRAKPEEEVPPEERARRLRVEVERLAGLPLVEWMLYLEDTAKKHNISQIKLKAMVNATIKRVEKERAASDSEIRQDRAEREEALEALRCLPRGEHEDGLTTLARRLGEDIAGLRDEFTLHAGLKAEAGPASEAWPEPVDTRELLDDIIKQVRCYAVVSDNIAITVALWAMFAWTHEVAIHSPLLVLTSAEENTGKTTISGVLKFLVPRPHSAVELTGPGLFRMANFLRPTLIIDEADQLLQRKCDLMHIINAGWTRGMRIPRIVRGELHMFDPFCPKIISMKGLDLPDTTASRAIVCKLVPKLESEKVAFFRQTDTEEFSCA